MGTDHVLLTRFNLPSVGVEEVIRAREGWLRERVALFERHCLPSVAAQTQSPRWIVYFDPESPAWLQERIQQWQAMVDMTPVLRESVSREELLDDLRGVVGGQRDVGDVLITTNLDNDDAIAPDFSARLRAVRSEHDRAAIYLVRGLIATDDALHARTDRVNAFCSVRERWSDPVTAWSGYHNELGRQMPVVRLAGAPAWLQVVHGTNVSNRVRGRRVSPRRHRAAFPSMSVPEPSRGDLWRDHVVRAPARWLRDSGRAGARRALLAVLGKDGYSSAKLRLSRLAGRA